MLSLHNLPGNKGKKKKRVGRGNSSSGNYSGRGMKGQRSRSGGKGGLKLRGLKQSLMAVPKSRGFTSPNEKPQTVNLDDLEATFEANAEVTAASLKEANLVTSVYKDVKVLGRGDLKKSLTVKVQAASESAKEAIEKAGGKLEIIPATKKSQKSAKQD